MWGVGMWGSEICLFSGMFLAPPHDHTTTATLTRKELFKVHGIPPGASAIICCDLNSHDAVTWRVSSERGTAMVLVHSTRNLAIGHQLLDE